MRATELISEKEEYSPVGFRLTGCGKTISAQQNIDGPHVRDKPGLSGYLVHLVSLMQPNKPDRTEQTK
jgi:hypothetical protein